MKFVIAGLGSIGRRHLRNLAELGEKDILLYRTHQSTLSDEELEEYPVSTDLQAALESKPDAVIVSNPTALHLDVAIPAAHAGAHILLEKPVSHSMDRVDELQQVAAEHSRRVMMGFQFRYHPTLQKARTLILDQAIGRPVSARVHWGEYLPGWHPWEDHRSGYAARKDLGGGVILTLSHPLDYLAWMFGETESLTAVTAPAEDALGSDVDALAEITLQYGCGVIGSVHLDYLQRPGSHTLEVNGTTGSIRWNNATGALRIYRASTDQWESYLTPEGFERNWLFLEEMRSFIRVIKNKECDYCTLDEGIRVQQLVSAAYESAAKGVRIKLD